MSATERMESRTPRRWPWVLILIGSAAWIGLVVGTTFGATRVPEGSGLAGPAIALGYGVLGAGLLLVRRLAIDAVDDARADCDL